MRILIWLLFAVLTGVYISRPLSDPDLWGHLVAGDWILSHIRVPYVDYWTMFSSGHLWRAYSWMSEAVFAFVEGHGGVAGLVLLEFAVAFSIVISFFYCFGRIAKDWFFGALLGMLTSAGCVSHFTLRPQSLTWAFLVWIIYIADRISEEGFTRKRGLQTAFVMALWANTHITTILGLVALAAWVISRGGVISGLKALLCGFAGTLVTPYCGGEWLTFFSKADHPLSFKTIVEFEPSTILSAPTGIFVIILSLLLAFLHLAPSSAKPLRLAAALLFSLGGLAVVKFMPVAIIFLSGLVASEWKLSSEKAGTFANLEEGFERLRRLYGKLVGPGLAFFLVCLIALNAVKVLQQPLSLSSTPVNSVNFIKEQKLPHPVLNLFGDGGYLMHAFANPDGTTAHPVVMDGRTNLIPDALWKKYHAAKEGQSTWRDYLDAVNPETVLWRSELPLASLLTATGEWCRVYRDASFDGYSVFVKRPFFEANREKLQSDTCD